MPRRCVAQHDSRQVFVLLHWNSIASLRTVDRRPTSQDALIGGLAAGVTGLHVEGGIDGEVQRGPVGKSQVDAVEAVTSVKLDILHRLALGLAKA